MERKTEFIGIASIIAIVFFVCFIMMIATDRKGPNISYDENKKIVYTQGEENDVLLEDVRAVDKRDGDVSDSLIVASKIPNSNGTMKVIYAAKDEHNNISQISRIVEYIKTETDDKPTEELNNGESNEENTNEATGEDGVAEENETQSEYTADIDKEKANETGIPVIRITKTEVTITEEETFTGMQALAYVKETYDNSGDVSRRIHIKGTEDKYAPGDYDIVYTVSDTSGNVSEPVILKLHVTKKDS